MNSKAKSLLIEALKKSTKKSQWMDASSALFVDNKIGSVFDGVDFGTFPSRFVIGVDTCADVVVISGDKSITVRFEDVFDIQTETPEEKKAFEAMGGVEWKNGDECIYQGKPWHFVSILSDEFHGTAVIFERISEKLKQVDLSKLEKPETPEQKAERERLEFIDSMFVELNPRDVKELYDGHRNSSAWKLCAKAYDAGYRKQ